MSVLLDGSMGELVEVVSDSNEPTGVLVPRSCAHSEGLLHRTVYVLLSNAAGELLLQRRHERKAVCPGKWDLSCAEHCAPGESYLQAAERGCLEERLGQLARPAPVTGLGQQPQGPVVDRLGVLSKKERASDVAIQPTHATSTLPGMPPFGQMGFVG